MRLYFFDQTDWIAANTEEEAVNFYKEENSVDEIEMKEIDVEEVPESEWKDKTISLEECDENDQVITLSFEEYLKQFSETDLPMFVASTEY